MADQNNVRRLSRVTIETGVDLVAVVEAVHDDHLPRLVERNGRVLALVVAPDEAHEVAAMPKSRRFKDRLLALAGSWSDLDADAMIERLYAERHEAPPSRTHEW